MQRPLYRRLLPPRVGEQLDQEIALHRELLVSSLRARGMTAQEAERRADSRLGDLAGARAECLTIGYRRERRMLRSRTWDAFVQDLRFAGRSLGRQKGWAAVALVTLALGIGASTAVFSVVNSLLLHPVAYPGADRIVTMMETPTDTPGMQITMGPFGDALIAWRGHSRQVEAIEPYRTSDMTWMHNTTAVVAHATAITPGFLGFAGLHVVAGRNFVGTDAMPGATHVAMLSEQLWRGEFGAAPSIFGRTVTLDGDSYTVIGIMPGALQTVGYGVNRPDFWLPLALDAAEGRNLLATARLRPGATLLQAQQELDTLAARTHVKSWPEFRSVLARPAELVNFRSSLLLLAGAVALVLIIACANVAHLFLARGMAREREFAIRVALGAGRFRLFRQLVTESLAVALAGCAAGVLLGWIGLQLLLRTRPDGLAELATARIDATVILAAVGVSLLTGLVFGVASSLQFALRAPGLSLRAGARGTSGSRSQHRLRSALVVSEMAMAAMLLIGATLLVRSMISLQGADIGFGPRGLYAIHLPSAGGTKGKQAVLLDRFLGAVHAIPGVTDVTLAQNAQPSIGVMFGALEADGKPGITADPFVSYNAVRGDFFRVMRIPLLEGRPFADTTASSPEVIVNRGLARRYWGNASAIGQRIRVGSRNAWMTIVGVAPDVSQRGASGDVSAPMIYTPAIDGDRATVLIRVREGVNPMPAIRALFASLDPHLAPPALSSVEADFRATLARPRFTMLLLTLFTLIAVVLAAVGLYGVLAFAVSERTREIGIRMALGATRGNVLRSVTRSGLMFAGTGAVLGVAGAHWGTKVVESMLHGVKSTDPVSVGVGVVILLLTALAACIVPARRAIAIDPMRAIRSE